MDFLSSKKPTSDHPEDHHQQLQHQPPSSSELFSSAKLVADAAGATFRHESDKLDKAKVADAGADLLGAAQHYGKLDERKGIGKYVDKAEDYLHNYHVSHSTTTTTTAVDDGTGHPSATTTTDTSTTHPNGFVTSTHSTIKHSDGEGDGQSGGGSGGYLKMAEGFLKK